MRITSKKMLAIVLSVAMLASCMVFSFSANAGVDSFDWDVNFNSEAQQNAYVPITGSSVAGNYTTGGSAAYGRAEAVLTGGRSNGTDGALQVSLTSNATGKFVGMRVCNTNAGFEKPNGGVNTLVSFWYKPTNITGAVKVYAALAGFYWGADCSAANFRGGSQANAVVEIISASSNEWKYASVLLKTTQTEDGVHLCFSTGAKGSTILIDDIRVRSVDPSEITSVTYVYNDTVVGKTASGAAGTPLSTPALDIPMILPEGYEFVAYTDSTFTTKADVSVYPTQNETVYLRAEKITATQVLVENYDRTPFLTDEGAPNTEPSGDVSCTDKMSVDEVTYWRYNRNWMDGNGSGRWVTNAYNHTDEDGVSVALNPQPYRQDIPAATQLKAPATGSIFTAAANNNGYVVTFWARAGAGNSGTAKFSLKTSTASGHDAATAATVDLADEWQQVELQIGKVSSGANLYLFGGYQQFPTGLDKNKTEFENLEAGVDCFIYVDDISIEPAVHFTYTGNDDYLQDFEGIPNFTSLKNENHGVGGNAALTSSAKRSGNQSVWLQTENNTGAARIQFNIPGIDSEFFTAEKGTTYKVTFYVKPKDENPQMQMNFWLAAADKDKKFSNGGDKDNYKLYEASNVELVAGAWNKISFTTTDPVNDVYAGGVMRLGICGPEAKTYDFWVDDIKVEEYIETSAWGFESEELGTNVDSRKSKGYTSVSDNYAHSGSQSLFVYNGTDSGRDRNQIYLKDGAGNNVTVKADKTYLVSFYAMATSETAKDVALNMWFATGDGTAVRPTNWSEGDGKLRSFIDDVTTNVITLTDADKKNKWVKVTRYLKITDVENGDKLLMGISDAKSDHVGGHWYMDDVSVVCVEEDIAITEKDRTVFLYRGETKKGYTNLHKNINDPTDTDVYTSIRLGAKYRSGDANGSTYILDGVEYEIVERGIVAGTKDMKLDATGTKGTDYLWKSSKDSNNGFTSNWENVGVDVADAADQHEITYTLRLANMSEGWFDPDYKEFEFRSYFKLRAPYIEQGSTEVKCVEILVCGDRSGAFTFYKLVDENFTTDFWFTDLNPDE